MSDFDPYRDYDKWSKAVQKSALEHAVTCLNDANNYKAPQEYLVWCARLTEHLNEFYSTPLDAYGNPLDDPGDRDD